MRIIILILALMYLNSGVHSQCPDRAVLRERIYKLRTSDVPEGQQLRELLPFSFQLEKCPRVNDSVRVLLLQRIGVLYYLTGSFKEAAAYTINAIDLLQQKSNTYTDTTFLIRAYYFLHIYFDSLKMVGSKMNALDSSISYALSATDADHQILLFNLLQRSTYALDVGDFQSCANYSSIGESITNKYALPAERNVYMINFFVNRMNAYISMNDFESAEMEIHNKIDELNKAKLGNVCGPLYNQLSIIFRNRHIYDSSIAYLQQSLDCNMKNGGMLETKQTINNLGFLYLNYLHEPASALRYFNEAIKYSSKNEQQKLYDEIETSNIFSNKGIAYAQLNKFDSAFDWFRKAFEILGKGVDENTLISMPIASFISNPKLIYIVSLVREKANVFVRQFQQTGNKEHVNEALRIFRIADRILTKVKATQTEMQSKLAWRTNAKVLYEQAINACYIANRPEDAFYFFERSRAVLLNDQIFLNRSLNNNDIYTRSQIELKIEELKSELARNSNDSDRYAEIQENILFLSQQRDRINATKTYADTARLELVTFRHKYNVDGKTMLEVFTGDSSVFVLAVTAENVRLKRIDRTKFNDLSNRFIAFVADPIKTNNLYNSYLDVSNRLYHLVIDSLKITGKLIISPDEENFPFEALIMSVKKGKPEYLIQHHAVTYTYSAGFLLLDFTQQIKSSPLLLGMAPVYFPSTYNLAALQGSDESIKKIISRFRASQWLINSSATKAEFLNSFYKFKIVQLYTHGAETGKSGAPVIYFADSALNLFDLIPVNKPATELIVLSACETAKGRYYKGEGVFSFNRAFAEAGIPSSMVNLWSVDNQSSYRLTELFYKYLSENMEFDEALRQAKIEFVATSGREKSLPYYWAATVLAGRSSSLQEKTAMSWTTTAGFILLAIAVVIGLFRYFKPSEPYS